MCIYVCMYIYIHIYVCIYIYDKQRTQNNKTTTKQLSCKQQTGSNLQKHFGIIILLLLFSSLVLFLLLLVLLVVVAVVVVAVVVVVVLVVMMITIIRAGAAVDTESEQVLSEGLRMALMGAPRA